MRSRTGSLLAGLGLVLFALGPAAAGPLASKPVVPPLVVPIWSLTGECYPIDFTDIDIEWYAGRGVYQLTVSGVKPYTNMEVSLSHEAYNGRPGLLADARHRLREERPLAAARRALLRDHEFGPVRGQQGHRDRRRLAERPTSRAALLGDFRASSFETPLRGSSG